MHIHINGNLGYVGPVLVSELRNTIPEVKLSGFDTAFFAPCLLGSDAYPERMLDIQFFGDLRQAQPISLYQEANAVIQLAAISNDPMGKEFEQVTHHINTDAVYESAVLAKKSGVTHFVFASSCSVYGEGGDFAKSESANLNPLSAYAQSKINAEEHLRALADDNFIVTCLRFATACGWSPRLRLDLVLNDFVASAILNGRINILSDGSPWRPLIHVKDMARAMLWAAKRNKEQGGEFLIVNTGSNEWNYQVRDLAFAVRDVIANVDISINHSAPPDKRSYRVDFSSFNRLAPGFVPRQNLISTISELISQFRLLNFSYSDIYHSPYIRLKVLNDLRKSGKLDEQLYWISEFNVSN
jgi:nucleoside-diphosphate-sugar epimerase